ncbi:hypothetical protein OB960_25970, partial [Halobacteria archaeon AArc-xg1-1]|nr:hypothetical protein [Halobacteria archaeon AArc-xg1-1]
MALDTVPQSGPDTSGLILLDVRFGRVGGAVLVVSSPESALARAHRDASEGASESAQMEELVE